MNEKLTLIFKKNGEILKHKWVIKKGLRGARDAKKVIKLQREWGDPVAIIGDGSIATLLKREYKLYNHDKEHYGGVPAGDILKAGAEITGVPVKRLQKASRKIRRKLRK